MAKNLEQVRQRVAQAALRAGRDPSSITIVGVAKTFPAEAIQEAYRAGLRHIAENRVQEAQAKRPELVSLSGVTWHMVGHLQTNKVKAALQLFDVVHSMDSLRLAEDLSRQAQRELPVLVEVNVAGEYGKFGVAPEEEAKLVEAVGRLPQLRVIGLMTVAPLVPEPEEVRPLFRRLRKLADSLGLRELSMGMSDDFEVAIEEGATLVRIGRAIFGARPTA
ncbi:MAG: YggS family pyridoxal phosphate-dependent enzyme [Chloroflexi bacterium]|nr:YggS family pyridoxal phosphate-dependent enzyme [Chloroflexota bacterium]